MDMTMTGGRVRPGRRAVVSGLTAGAALALAGCGDDGDSTPPAPSTGSTSDSTGGSGDGLAGGRYTVLGALREIPATVLEAEGQELTLSTADLVAASEHAGVARPTTDAGVPEWAMELGGARAGGRAATFVNLADLPGLTMAAQTDAVRKDLGWSVLDVDRFVTFTGALPRGRFVAVTGERLGSATIERLPTVIGPIRTAGEGADFAVDAARRTPARPLGSPLRMAARGSTIAAAPATPVVEGWLAEPRRSAADDRDLAAVARALDDRRSVSAILFKPSGQADDTPDDTRPSPSGPRAPASRALGIGWRAESGEARVVVCYAFADEAAATAARPAVESAWRTGTAAGSGRPISDLVTVDAVEVDGPVVVMASRPTGDAPTAVYAQMLIRREPVLVPPG